MNITITKPLKAHEEEIKKLFITVITQNFKDYGFYKKYRDDIAYEVGKQTNALDAYFDSNGKKIFFLIAKDGNKIIGTIAYGKPNIDIEKYYSKKPDNIIEIKSLYVLPDYQGKGIGTKLFKKIMIVLQQNGFKEFCLDSGYPKAQLFWTKKLGEPVVKISNRWNAGNDYLIWHYKL
jgi:GNAT superfamily N-acetyltransferase